MNFHLFLFVIVFGPWVTASEIPRNSTENSLGIEETKKRGPGEGPLAIWSSKVVSPTKAFLQSLRRLLKIMRKWCRSHPLEVKLARCFASYFNIKIPGLRRYDQLEGYDDNIGGPKRKKPQNLDFLNLKRSRGRKFTLTTPKCINNIIETFRYYFSIVKNNQIIVCMWDYISKKFWSWVDSAPDT